MTHSLSPDTQAVLLLCNSLGANNPSLRPLTTGEYDKVVRWLVQQQKRPGDLLTHPDTLGQGEATLPIPVARLEPLLERGVALSLMVERWQNQGLWVISRSDTSYPRRLRSVLGRMAPPLLFGSGPFSLLQQGGTAIVGSRSADERQLEFARRLAGQCAAYGQVVISGAAKGVDSEAMLGAWAAGGPSVGVVSATLSKLVLSRKFRAPLRDEQITLISPFDPDIPFFVSNAMARNKYVYALSDRAVVVATAVQEGGTWAGAIENLNHRWVPLFVWDAPLAGNQALIAVGGVALPDSSDMPTWIERYMVDHRPAAPVPEVTQLHLLEANSTPATPPPLVALPPDTPAKDDFAKVTDLFLVLWPVMADLLQAERTEEEVATLLEIERSQARKWLQRAVAQGQVRKLSRPVRYIAVRQPEVA